MPNPIYSASKTRSNRPGWSLSFRHPLLPDPKGRLGRKVRRGLGTTDTAHADRLVAQMNVLLGNSSWWSRSKRSDASERFSEVVVAAFYDLIPVQPEDSESLREEAMALPTPEDGYSRVLFVGTTGAGKTSLLRQMIGSDPVKDRFPSTAPAKTTIADIEVLQSQGDYFAVVTFFGESHIRTNVEECIVDACLVASDSQTPDTKIAERLLNHRDQKFRLGYVLGDWGAITTAEEEDEFSFDLEPDEPEGDVEGLGSHERTSNRQLLRSLVARIKTIAGRSSEQVSTELGEDFKGTTGANREAFEELIEESIRKDPRFGGLARDIMKSILHRFTFVEKGELERGPTGWPFRWTYVTGNRSDFITQVRWFSSNHWREFGRLLTPVVNGIRVKGPLFPSFSENGSPLVLIDGQGLGHTPDSSSSVTTRVTRRFDTVDVILLVDNAKQPMQAASLSVLRSVAASGHSEKLLLAFTHFDQIKGPALRTQVHKRTHVMDSVRNALSNLSDVLGTSATKTIERNIERKCFMLGGIDRQLSRLPVRPRRYMQNTLTDLVAVCGNAKNRPPQPEAHPSYEYPVYDPTEIAVAVQRAVSRFQEPWLARLGLRAHKIYEKEHWARVKALNRRIATGLADEYGKLKPVADLVDCLMMSLSGFLDEPIVRRNPLGEEQGRRVIDKIKQGVSRELHGLAFHRLVEQHIKEWRNAYELRGKGSTFVRARRIHGIYDEAAPSIGSQVLRPSDSLLKEVRRIVTEAIEVNGGHMRLVVGDRAKAAPAREPKQAPTSSPRSHLANRQHRTDINRQHQASVSQCDRCGRPLVECLADECWRR